MICQNIYLAVVIYYEVFLKLLNCVCASAL